MELETTLENLKLVAAVVDVQGFSFTTHIENDEVVPHFLVREFATVSLSSEIRLEYDVPNQQAVRRRFDAYRVCDLHLPTLAFRTYNCALTKAKAYIHWIKDQTTSYDEPDGFGNKYLGNVQAGPDGEPSGIVQVN